MSSNKFVRFSLRELLAVNYLIFSISDFIQNFIPMGSQTLYNIYALTSLS